MRGTNAKTGKAIEGTDHLAQSITDILTTPIGSRVMLRDYGSRIPEIIDAAVTKATVVQLYGATAVALMRWERRVRLKRVQLYRRDAPGGFVLDLQGERTDLPKSAPVNLSLPLRLGARA